MLSCAINNNPNIICTSPCVGNIMSSITSSRCSGCIPVHKRRKIIITYHLNLHIYCLCLLICFCLLINTCVHIMCVVVIWRSGSVLFSINEVNLRRARLVLGWATVSGFNSRRGTFTSVCNQPLRLIQPGQHVVSRSNKCQPKGGDVLRLGSKIR